MSASTIGFVHRLEPEDQVRADFYALLARLYFSAPDSELLRIMGSAPLLAAEADAAALAIAWAKLAAAARVMDAEAAQDGTRRCSAVWEEPNVVVCVVLRGGRLPGVADNSWSICARHWPASAGIAAGQNCQTISPRCSKPCAC
jgi:hypothetical protein